MHADRLGRARARLEALDCPVPWDDDRVLASATDLLKLSDPKPSVRHRMWGVVVIVGFRIIARVSEALPGTAVFF